MSEQKGKSVKNKELIKEKIIFYIKEHGYAPTVREICEMTNLKSTSSVQSYLCKMFEEGELEIGQVASLFRQQQSVAEVMKELLEEYERRKQTLTTNLF